MPKFVRIEFTENTYPLVPKSDDVDAATAVLNAVLKRSLVWTGELHAIANEHFDVAPASSEHASALSAIIARTVGQWIEEWPQ